MLGLTCSLTLLYAEWSEVINSDNLFVNEDVSKRENRVNLALFSLMQQDWFRT